MSYLEDGYLNHNTPGEPFQFDEVVFSDSQLERRFANDGNAGGYSKWIPTTQVMERILETDARAQALYGSLRSELGKKNDRMWIVDEGVGKAAVGSAINDSIFRYFLPEEQWGGVEWYALRAIEMEIHNETTNAISNWGLSKYLQGDYEFAILLFTRALDREDKFAEDESSFYLSKIYEKQGDLVKSEEYRKRCEAAGGYEPTYL
jgi:tetratricopeptide (TPR) repeat protein